MIPRAAYRLQFHAGFTFADAVPLAPYLARLGISHLYASPIAKARSGSTHGYDVVDPTMVNPELGGEEAFRELARAFRAEGLGVILDIVPNHMAVGGDDNLWWLDVLENGEASAYAAFFDIDWRPADAALHGKVLAPFLGAPYGQALAAGDIRLESGPDGQLAAVAYGRHRFPIRPQDRQAVLAEGIRRFDPGAEAGRARLHDLLERQNFRLAWWRTAGDEINWRRFFDITELAGVRTDRPEVFEALHALPLRLYAEGLIDGLRADHVDGLADPGRYCREVRARLETLEPQRPAGSSAGPAYFVVEKILAPGERLPPDWLCDGTTGYDFMNEVAALLHDPRGGEPLTRYWAEVGRRSGDFEAEERTARHEVVNSAFAGQLDAVSAAFHRLARADIATRDFSLAALRRGLVTLLSVFPAYRTYGAGDGAALSDRALLNAAADRAKAVAAAGEGPVLDQLIAWLAGEGPGTAEARLEAVRRFQQLSAPVSAKAVEDTAFYRYSRLLSRNDVGFDPGRLAADLGDFHAASLERAKAYPAAMLATATHDHKRGEDVRARLAVLSEMPEDWIAHARRWSALNKRFSDGIDPADEYAIYQMLTGALPLDLASDREGGLAAFRDRICGWLEKALREAKLRSSWVSPDQAYEQLCRSFVHAILAPGSTFRAELIALVRKIAPAGALNGLSQAFLRCVAPGVPDTYQGAEFWDFSLVDPDNRRPVDFSSRDAALSRRAAPDALMADWMRGAVKQAVIAAALRLRAEKPALFASGDYRPLTVRGARAGSVIAFARRRGDDLILAAAALRCADGAIGRERPTPSADWWGDTEILTPESGRGQWRDRLGATEEIGDGAVKAAHLFAQFPVALLSN